MTDPSILVDKRPGYRILTLNRPDKLNAFNDAMHEALRAAIDDAEADKGCRALIKRALDASATRSLDAQLDVERDLQRQANVTPDYAEGVRAFMEKRKPNFIGRTRADRQEA